jgi:UDP-N-acetylmuramoyl-tripeptide--D-alanyl-D-alanine ligase
MLPVRIGDITSAMQGRLHGLDPESMAGKLCTDTRLLQPGDLYWALEGETFDGHDFCEQAIRKGAQAVVIGKDKLPGLEVPSIRVADTLRALGDVANFLRHKSQARFVGITGSVGKTSTKELIRAAIGQVLKTKATEGNLNNLIGVPKTLAEIEEDDQLAVLEMGIDRPGEMDRLSQIVEPEIGVITTIGESHLERLGTVEKVLEEKSKLLRGLPEKGVAVVPHDSPFREELIASSKAPAVTFGTVEGADYYAASPKLRTRGCYGFLLKTPVGEGEVELSVPGLHQVQAATAAAAVGVSVGVPLEKLIQGLQTFSGVPGRCELIELNRNISVIADHYNANPVSMAAALRLLETFLDRRRVMVAGEMWDLGVESPNFHHLVGNKIGKSGVDFLFAVGPRTRRLVQGARESGFPGNKIRWFESTDQAASDLARWLCEGDVVLVKGSRGMRLERVIESLAQSIGRKAS